MQMSQRLDKLPPYLFVEINKKIAEKRAKGEDIISFAIGDPDIPTPQFIIDKICKEANNPVNHRYPETDGLPELSTAIAKWYRTRFNVGLDSKKEVLPLIGSKEGIGHVSFCLIDPGDIALVTDPGYPVYSTSTLLAGGQPYFVQLQEENNYIPDLDSIPSDIAKKAKVLWLNYPNNPTGAVADVEFFNNAIRFARENNLAICHDAPYTEVAFDGCNPPSIMQATGAKDVCIEFHSLSKTYNMTGWRIGMAVGNQELINALFRFKSNLDSGIPQAIQLAAIEALTGSQEHIKERNLIYQKRRDKLVNALNEIGVKAKSPGAGFYIWTSVPDGYTSVSFTAELIDKAGVAVTPGTGYGSAGEGYIRLSITVPDDRLEEGINRLMKLRK
ncbi:LL-diaminopimelate aminotransferase [Chloroflexota bacterium]